VRMMQGGIDRATLSGLSLRRLGGARAALPGHAQVMETFAQLGFGANSLSMNQILSDASRLRAVADHFRRELTRTQPRLAFVVSYYGLEGFAFVLACHEAGVPVVELQHGVQGANHPAYAAWHVARGQRHPLLPDYFWVWSEWEERVIGAWASGTGHRAIVGGNPWLAVWTESSDWLGVAEASKEVVALRARAGTRPVILVTLQFGLSPAIQLEPLARLLRSAKGRFEFWIRLHPLMNAERDMVRNALREAGPFVLEEATDLPLPLLLRHADLHLTHSSSSVIEAAQFGVRSVLTSTWGADLFGPYVDSGWAVVQTGDAAETVETCAKLALPGSGSGMAMPDLDRDLRRLLELERAKK